MNQERLYQIILGPHVSEKTTMMGEGNNQYAFRIATTATKPEVRKAVETLFKVTVTDLQILNVKGKTKRGAGGRIRRRSDWKKAYVRLEAGREIDFADIS